MDQYVHAFSAASRNQSSPHHHHTTSIGTRSATRTAARATRSATRCGAASLNPPVSNLEPRDRKKTKITSAAGVSSSNAAGASSSSVAGASSSVAGRTVNIEYCGQCDPFKKGLEKAVCGVNVILNPDPPRKGCFEIREKGGDVFESLLDMESPFEPLKALDVKKVVSDVVEKIK